MSKKVSPAVQYGDVDTPVMPGRGKRVLSFFTGAGGLDLGFEQAGFETVYATDHDPDSCATLKENVGKHLNRNMIIECADVLAIDPAKLPANIDLVIGGPPCQSFSASGRRAGGAAGRLDDRGNLFQAYANIIGHVRPVAFVFENVRGILATNKGQDWQEIVQTFRQLGYTISFRLLDALDYGAPQQRERMFLVGHKLATEFLFPEPTNGPDSYDGRPHITAGVALSGLVNKEDLAALVMTGGKYSHLLPLVPPGQNYLYFTAKRGFPNPIFAYRSRFSDFLYKASPDSPIKTLIASPGKYTGPVHWDNRYFSIAEYKRLQGFPDDYKFSGGRADIIRQIGNSVSPKIAYRLALAIASQMWGAESNVRLIDTNRVLSFDKRKGEKARATRVMHDTVEAGRVKEAGTSFFERAAYRGVLAPDKPSAPRIEVVCTLFRGGVKIKVSTGREPKLFARAILKIGRLPDPGKSDTRIDLTLEGYGTGPEVIRAMWDAVDDWVRRSSAFHSLFELYGHFTEPHPIFSIEKFDAISDHPLAKFAEHAANFSNCSRYLPKKQIVALFSNALETEDFQTIALYLRAHRYDIRSHETNVAIPKDVYMVAYPFTLPSKRQMNFTVQASVDYGVAAE